MLGTIVQDQAPLESAAGGEVEVFDVGVLVEVGGLDEPGQAVVLAGGELSFDEEAGAILEGERGVLSAVQLLTGQPAVASIKPQLVAV